MPVPQRTSTDEIEQWDGPPRIVACASVPGAVGLAAFMENFSEQLIPFST